MRGLLEPIFSLFFLLFFFCSVGLNRDRWTHEWLIGKSEMPKEELWNRDSPVWSRFYSSPGGIELGAEAESDLQKVRWWGDKIHEHA